MAVIGILIFISLDRLIDKAVQAINLKDPLPKGIRLVGCKWGVDEWY